MNTIKKTYMTVNKYIFFQLCIACMTLGAQAQETANRRLPPVRTSDPAVRHAAIVRPNLPLKSGGDAPQPKSTQSAVVPIRKADPSSAPAGGGTLKKQRI